MGKEEGHEGERWVRKRDMRERVGKEEGHEEERIEKHANLTWSQTSYVSMMSSTGYKEHRTLSSRVEDLTTP